MWQDGPRLYAVIVDNTELHDVDIFDVTEPVGSRSSSPTSTWSRSPTSRTSTCVDNSAFGNSIFHHDMVVKKIGDVQTMLVSYWDAGYVKLNVNDPTSPTFIGDSDFGTERPADGR